MVTINVTYRNGRPADNREVIIKWQSGGTTSGRTDSNGQVQLRTNGTAEYVQVSGEVKLRNVWLEGTHQQFSVD